MGLQPQAWMVILESASDGTFPNNAGLPLVDLPPAFAAVPAAAPPTIEKVLRENGWDSVWRNGVYAFHHYHGTAHDALDIYSGTFLEPIDS